MSVSGAAITGPRRPAPLGVVHQLGIGLDRRRAARAPERRDRARQPRQPLAHRVAGDGAHDERGRLADAPSTASAIATVLPPRTFRTSVITERSTCPRSTTRADGAADLVNGDQLAHARRQAFLVLLAGCGS